MSTNENASVLLLRRTAAGPRTPLPAGLIVLGMLATAGSALMLSGCNTTEGAGRDVQAVGRGIENAADGAKP